MGRLVSIGEASQIKGVSVDTLALGGVEVKVKVLLPRFP